MNAWKIVKFPLCIKNEKMPPVCIIINSRTGRQSPQRSEWLKGVGAILLHKEDYKPGAYTRKVLKGYLQFHQWGFYTTTGDVTISADRTRGARLFSDSIAAEWKENGIWDRQQYQAYMKAFEAFFDFERLEDQTDEQILFAVEQLRKEHLTYEAYDKALKWRLKRFLSLDRSDHILGTNEDEFFDLKLVAG